MIKLTKEEINDFFYIFLGDSWAIYRKFSSNVTD